MEFWALLENKEQWRTTLKDKTNIKKNVFLYWNARKKKEIRVFEKCAKDVKQKVVKLLLSFHFWCWGIHFFVIVNIFCHLPYLHDIVLTHRANHPWIIGIPRKVRNLSGVATMNEEKLRRTIFSILGALLFTYLWEIPNMESSVGSAWRQNCLIVRGPLDLKWIKSLFYSMTSDERLKSVVSRPIGKSGGRVFNKWDMICPKPHCTGGSAIPRL